MLIEGIATTRNSDGSVNVAAMGPIVDPAMDRLRLRPFKTSTTYANLVREAEGVFHVTDDVALIARAAIGEFETPPAVVACEGVATPRLADTCRWYAFRTTHVDSTRERSEITATVVARGRVRDFFGLNRAKHAVIEAAILATRLAWIDAEDVEAQLAVLAPLVDKTGGAAERDAFEFLRTYIAREHALERSEASS